jgi:cobalt-zinc-cadmium efflux system membrane fusion protein
LFGDPGFQLELTIYEPEGIPPEFRAYFTQGGEPIAPDKVGLEVTLERINRTEVIAFRPQQDYLRGLTPVAEPHSFRVLIRAEYGGRKYSWEYESIEGRTEMPAEMVEQAGIEICLAGPQPIRETLSLRGKVALDGDRTFQAIARFPGTLKELPKKLGDRVEPGEVLAVVESHQSLQTYLVRSQLAGTVVQRSAVLGESVDSSKVLLVVADLSRMWVDFHIYPQDIARVRSGQKVSIQLEDGGGELEAVLHQVAPGGVEESKTFLARGNFANPEGRLRAGMYVRGEVTVGEGTAEVAVKASALQTFRGWDVVFLRMGNLFEAAPVEIGRRDREWVEILEGVPLGAAYAAGHSFIIKADVMKSGATHDH